ncbi:MAG: RidA family protein [Rhodospirillaceae bacterium]|nr:enamine deaminase RidA [Rhodospirillaceae bacterium]RPG02576.1 MAG: RidA family protein [Rhodospirillaceae bacterium TMED63]RZO37024.1 MAG: RidA family protein [Rhodospirillaceae bacterium]
MSNKTVGTNPASVASPMKPHYSNSIRTDSGPLLFIAGQVALDADGKLVGEGDIRAQTTQVLENIRAIVAANGGTMADIAQVTVYVCDIEAFDSVSDIRESYFPSEGPASAIVEVSALAWPEFLIEIAAVAALPS